MIDFLLLVSLSIIFILFIIFVIYSFFQIFGILFFGQVPDVATKKNSIVSLCENIKISQNSKFYDLGCGRGKVLIEIYKKFGCEAVGFENNLFSYLLAKIRMFLGRYPIRIYKNNFFRKDLSDADYIYCYLLPKPMRKLEKKLFKELRPGTIVIANTFPMLSWEHYQVIETDSNKQYFSKLFIYKR